MPSLETDNFGASGTSPKDITGLIVAAGKSSRMGRSKALLPYDGSNFITRITDKLTECCGNVVIVTGHQSSLIEALFSSRLTSNITIVKNNKYELGMFSSLKAGLKVIQTKYVMYHFVDNPSLPDYFYTEFLSKISTGYNWFQPVYKGKKGHPIIFDRNTADKILGMSDEASLKEISADHTVKKFYWDCPFPGIHTDVDTPEDYKGLES